jgi:hypothetical protein
MSMQTGPTRRKSQPLATPSAKQERVATLLAAGLAIKDAAEQCGVGERTVHGWLERDGGFKAVVAAHRSRVVEATLGRLVEAGTKAVDALVVALDSGKDAVKVRAAAVILTQLLKVREATEVDARLTELETHIAKQRARTTRAT